MSDSWAIEAAQSDGHPVWYVNQGDAEEGTWHRRAIFYFEEDAKFFVSARERERDESMKQRKTTDR